MTFPDRGGTHGIYLGSSKVDLFSRKNLDFVDSLLLARESLGKGQVMTFDGKMKNGNK